MTATVEADAVARGLVQQGVQGARIFAERHARTTQDNAERVMQMLAQMGRAAPTELVLVVEPYQAMRAMRAFVCEQAKRAPHARMTLSLALTKRLAIEKAAVYVHVHNYEHTAAPPASVLKCLDPSQIALLERMRNDKMKLGWGF